MTGGENGLHDGLTDIRGIGNKKADTILETLREYDDGGESDAMRAIRANLAEAHEHHQSGKHAMAAKFVRRASVAAGVIDDTRT